MATARKKGRGFEIRVHCGYDTNGRKISKSKIWVPDRNYTPKQLEKELERQKIIFEDEVKYGKCSNGNVKFQTFADMWIEQYAEKQLAPSTIDRYKELLVRINKAIGHIRLDALTPLHLNSFYRNLEEPGIKKCGKRDENGKIIGDRKLSPKTIVEHHRLISKILSTAIKWQLIENNVANRADPPKVPSKEMYFLSEDDAKTMLKKLADEPIQYKTMITILIYTGLRRGELCGLEWSDIDFETHTMRIVRSAQYVAGKHITKEPKTNSGKRQLTLSNSIITLLKEYKDWQNNHKATLGDLWQETDRLFTQYDGKPIHPDTITGWFASFIKRNNFPKVTLHSLRHTNATLMIAEGTDIRTVSNRLGHAQTSTTLNIYAHALKSRDAVAAERLDALLNFE